MNPNRAMCLGMALTCSAVLISTGCHLEKAASIHVRRVVSQGDDFLEEWERVTDEPDIRGVSAGLSADTTRSWQVDIYVAEFVREEPLESELHAAITSALESLPGVSRVAHDDREVWLVEGGVTGDALVRACAVVVDAFAARTRQAYEAL